MGETRVIVVEVSASSFSVESTERWTKVVHSALSKEVLADPLRVYVK